MSSRITELREGYELDRDAKGITGQRVFLEDKNPPTEENIITNTDIIELPQIGSPMWNRFDRAVGDSIPNCYCIKESIRYFGNDTTKILHTYSYSNEPIDKSNMLINGANPTAPIDPNKLPTQIDYNGEFILWKASTAALPNSNWVWEDTVSTTPVQIANAIPFRVRSFTKKIQRIVPNDRYEDFSWFVQDAIGKVNENAILPSNNSSLAGGKSCWLFTGANSEMFFDQSDRAAYRFDLTFVYRDPDNSDDMGWQKILDSTGADVGKWRIAWDTYAGMYLYRTTNFNLLFGAFIDRPRA